jgi:aminobenzoyl-glutamate transport protein
MNVNSGKWWAPDAITIIALLCAAVFVASIIAAWFDVAAVDPATGDLVHAQSLASPANIARFLTDLPTVFSSFHPLALVIIVMFGAGLAEKVGLFEAALTRAFRHVPDALLIPATALIGILSHIGADAGYFVFIPLAGLAFQAAGRDPLIGICVAFASVSGGYGANILITPTDTVVYGITQAATITVDKHREVNLLSNYYLHLAFALVTIVVVWLTTKYWVEPRFADRDHIPPSKGASMVGEPEGRGLVLAGLVMALVLVGALGLALPRGSPLRDENGGLKPFYDSLVTVMFLAFLLGGLVFGIATRRIRSDRDVIHHMKATVADLSPFVVLVLFASLFGAFLTWSNLATIIAAAGALQLQLIGLQGLPLVLAFMALTAALNLVMPSASGKWAIIAPTAIPMLMAAGLTPEIATAAYRIGDSATNVITPTSLLPVVLVLAQRHRPDLSLIDFIRMMMPYCVTIFLGGGTLIVFWLSLQLPLGPTGAEAY